ncbi:MAG: sulfotransferase [Acidobacteria bacterium]|nr:sulfotransferase [Acidobacteriota bacterium]
MRASFAEVQGKRQDNGTGIPIFVVGSARSGTTLLYHMLLSSGRFAHFFGEPAVFDLLVPKFGDLSIARNAKRMMNSWIGSKIHQASGLDDKFIRAKVLNECRSNADFLRIVMNEVARRQGLQRWAVWGPDNLLCMGEIKSQMPEACFIHIIRDGHDVALSMDIERFIRPFPGQKHRSLLVAGLHWRWKVQAGRQQAGPLVSDYLEVHFEDLVSNPPRVLAEVSRFVSCDLDYARIRVGAVGAVKSTNSSFRSLDQSLAASPIHRWKRCLTQNQIAALELCIGDLLQSLRYELASPFDVTSDQQFRWMRAIYPVFFSSKHWLKQHTRAGRLASIARMRAN